MNPSHPITAALPEPDAAQVLAESSVAALHARDRTAAVLTIEVETVAPGCVSVSMPVTSDMTNGHGVVHGGYLFILADTAFAYASSTHGGTVVSRHADIAFVAPGQAGDRLVATATERSRKRNSGIYDVSVTLPDGTKLAEFRGHSHGVRGPFVARR